MGFSSRQLSESQRNTLNRILRENLKRDDKFEFPCELDRFSPKRLSGELLDRSNRILLYYISKDRGYDNSLYLDGRELGELGFKNSKAWGIENGIYVDNYTFVTEKVVFPDGKELSFVDVERKGVIRVYNSSLEGKDFSEYVTEPDEEAPRNLIDIIRSSNRFFGMPIIESDSFSYDGEEIHLRNQEEDESDYDYLFKLLETMMKATGKVYRHESQKRKFKKRGLEKIPFEEMMVVKFATLMYMADERVDISRISKSFVTLEDAEDLDTLKDRLKSSSVMSHYANEAKAAVLNFKKYLDR